MRPPAGVLLTLLFAAAIVPSESGAVERCKARINGTTGAIEVFASGVAGNPLWAGSLDATGVAFADAASCVRGAKLRRCHFGPPETLAEITPPAECRVCIRDGGATTCCAFLRGCTPGLRLRDASFGATDPRFCQGLAAADPACAPVGTWERLTGSIFPDGNDGTPEVVTFDSAGTGQMVFRPAAGILSCPTFTFAKGTGSDLVVNLSDDSPIGDQKDVAVLHFTRPDASRLVLGDAKGSQASFALVAAPSADLTCHTFTPVRRFDSLPAPESGSGLAFDGALLWYTERQTLDAIAVNPVTGAVVMTVDVPLQGRIQASAGGDFWTLDGGTAAARVQLGGTQVDVVDTNADLGTPVGIFALAFDAARGILFLHGATQGPVFGERLLRVDSAAEPDVLLASVEMGENFLSLAFDGTNLWGVRGTSVVRLDPSTGAGLESFARPDAAVRWRGVAAVGTSLALVGEVGGSGVLVVVTP